MYDQIITYLRQNPDGTSSRTIAEMFLKFKSPIESLAAITVQGILSKDRRAVYSADKLWRASLVTRASDAITFDKMPLVSVSVSELLINGKPRAAYVSAWKIFPEPEYCLSGWLIDPAGLDPDTAALLVDKKDPSWSPADADALITGLIELLKSAVPVFLSPREQSLLAMVYDGISEPMNDASLILTICARAAEKPLSRPVSIESAARALVNERGAAFSAYQSGALLASCVQACVHELAECGIETVSELHASRISQPLPVDFSSKKFSLADLEKLPECPGVYAFTNSAGAYVYIGKSTNIKQRVLGYFYPSDESPGKLDRLRAESHAFTIVPCGSDLESLLLEYRLIKKHAPLLNRQIDINERPGVYRPIDDCIVLLPHTETHKGVSFWFKQNQKIRMRPFADDFSDETLLLDELESFFMREPLLPAATDFAEMEIVTRWYKRHIDSLLIVPVSRLAHAGEILEQMKIMWQEASV